MKQLNDLPNGLVVVLKQDCPTCRLVEPAVAEIAVGLPEGTQLTVISQDIEKYPEGLDSLFDESLDLSMALEIEFVPTILKVEGGKELARSHGWHKEQWRTLTEIKRLGEELPDSRPGCGSLHLDPSRNDELARKKANETLTSRSLALAELEDPLEACFERGWTDGLPVVPPTPERVARMLEGTTRSPQEILGDLAPDQNPCSVEKVAINAVMAGCQPEYLPVVLTAVEIACDPAFNWHGLACTTYFAGPVMVVNGPIAKSIGMNSGMNALGQGNRANSTIGRALQLTLRNVGGAKPGAIDRATLGNPGKLSFCFAENEDESHWTSLAEDRGVSPGESAVTLFAGEGPRAVVDQISREPESLVRSFARNLQSVGHYKLVIGFDAMLVISPEHEAVFQRAGWSKDQFRKALVRDLERPRDEIVRGADGCDEGVPLAVEQPNLPKFRPGGLLITHAGGKAGLFSAIIGGWVSGAKGSDPVTRTLST